MNDKSFEELFSDFQPELSDDTRFISALERKLEAVEYIKQYQKTEQRRSKVSMLIVFVLGLCFGAAAMAVVFTVPSDFTLYSFDSHSVPMLWMAQNFRVISAIPLSIFVCYMIAGIISLRQEILYFQ